MAFRDGREATGSSGGTTPPADSSFGSLIKYVANASQELRSEETSTVRYHGRALVDSSEDDAVWELVKFDKDANEDIVRARYTSNVKWSERGLAFP